MGGFFVFVAGAKHALHAVEKCMCSRLVSALLLFWRKCNDETKNLNRSRLTGDIIVLPAIAVAAPCHNR